MSALDIGWNTEAWAKTGFRPFGRDSLDCGANYGNGVHWSVPLTGLTLYSSDATLDLCLMYSSLSGTWSGFSIYILYFLCVFSRQLWCSMSRHRLRPYWHSNILEESSQLINTGLGSSHKYRRTSTSHSCPIINTWGARELRPRAINGIFGNQSRIQILVLVDLVR